MNLTDAPIAREGFFATHFFTVSDQDKSCPGKPRGVPTLAPGVQRDSSGPLPSPQSMT
jgi:hypothetical protein